jgi:hypothetical protein
MQFDVDGDKSDKVRMRPHVVSELKLVPWLRKEGVSHLPIQTTLVIGQKRSSKERVELHLG